jgi:hypothetical protein
MRTTARPSLLARFVAAVLLTTPFALAAKKTALAPAADFVAHERGTFASVQGADGVQFEWNPFVAPEENDCPWRKNLSLDPMSLDPNDWLKLKINPSLVP